MLDAIEVFIFVLWLFSFGKSNSREEKIEHCASEFVFYSYLQLVTLYTEFTFFKLFRQTV